MSKKWPKSQEGGLNSHLSADTGKFAEIPAGNLHHDIVQTGLEARRGLLRHGIAEIH